MTRDELIKKRKRKKRNKTIGTTILIAGAVTVWTAFWSGVIPGREALMSLRIDPDKYMAFFQNNRNPESTESVFIPALEGEWDDSSYDSTESASYDGPTGWQEDDEGRFYVSPDGSRRTGWFRDESGSIFLLNHKGYAMTGWQNPETGRVYLDENGVLTIGLKEIDGALYYFGYDGVNLTGWQDVGVKTYYFSPEDGKAYIGWNVINDEDCYFNEEGVYEPLAVKQKTYDGPVIALTFDDGPGVYTDEILDLLEQYDAKATFFMIGEQIDYFASSVKREHDLGMEQGNHSWDHSTLTHLTGEEIRNQVSSTNDVLRNVTGDNPTVFRPPGGGLNDDVFANSCGLPVILWSIDTLDWKTKNAKATYNCVMENAHDGDIILMHEIYQASVDAAKMFIPELIEKGYTFVTVSELAEIKGTELTTGIKYGSF